MPAIEVADLAKTYGDQRALDGVSLAVDEGECLALLGPNGAGKSTLIDILATIQAPTDGEASIMGRSVLEEPHAVRRRVGVAFQRPITHDHLSARELVHHQSDVYAMPREAAQRRADELLAFVDLADRADDRLSTFSEGMKRRADLARVLVTEPDVLLLDEPAAGLDPRGRRAIRDRLSELARQGTTLLVATHHMREVDAIADRVAVLHEGRLRAVDRPSTLRERLGHRVVRVRLAPEGDATPVRRRLEALDVADVRRHGFTIETVVTEDGPSAGRVVDELEGVEAVAEVSVQAPDLGDVFLDVTGRPLEAEDEEVPA